MVELPAHDAPDGAADPWWKRRASWLYSSLTVRELADHDATHDTRYEVRLESVGTLSLPGGWLVAADPYVMDGAPAAFKQRLSASEAEVIAARAVVGDDHERVAALVLRVTDEPVAEWVMGTVGDQDAAILDADGYVGYPVDAGTGSFGSPEAMALAGRVLAADAGMLGDPVSEALFEDGVGTRSAVLVAPEAGSPLVAVCSSGWGDGLYPTWFGFAADGSVSVVLTDFLLTGDPFATPITSEATPEPEAPKRRESWVRRLFGS